MDIDQFVIDVASKLNEYTYLDNVKVPVLVGYELVPNEGTIFTAAAPTGAIEQFLCDGTMEDSFEEHIENVLKDMRYTMEAMELNMKEDSISFYKDYSNDHFQFKVYTQDLNGNDLFIRQFNIFFVDPKTNAFYQLSLSSAPYPESLRSTVTEKIMNRMVPMVEELIQEIHY